MSFRMPSQSASVRADEAVRAVLDDPDGRLRLAATCVSSSMSQVERAYHRALMRFLQWEVDRGVLNAVAADPAGSAWWRSINGDLLSGLIEAHFLHQGEAGSPSNRVVKDWLSYFRAPTASRWFLAHNRSIVRGYVAHELLARRELEVERYVMNFTLVRLFYAHALVTDGSLALGHLAPLAPLLGSPRAIERFIIVPHIYPEEYPMDGLSTDDLLYRENWLGQTIDFGVISSRLPALYEFALGALGVPEIADFIDGIGPNYGSFASGATAWNLSSDRLFRRMAIRAAHRLFAVKADQ
jgi:hypothetical protein